jgi:peptide/nickel transport system substrate-binding protein
MRTRSSRGATKVALAGLVSFALVAAACGGDDDDESQSTDAPVETEASGGDEPEPEPEPETEPVATEDVTEGEVDTEDVVEEPEETGPIAGGTIRYGLEAEVDGINPTTSQLSSPGLMMSNAVFDTLTAFDTNNEAVPYLAESFAPVDGDLSKWQFKLREGITFHDGTPLNAEAVVANFEAQRASLIVGLAVNPYYPEEGAIEIIDDLTVQYNLLDQTATFPTQLATQIGMVASPTWLAATLEDATLNQEPVGTGPFVFDSRAQDSVTRFVGNDAWWDGDVFLDAIEFLPVVDPDTRNDLLFSGDFQALQTTNPASVGDLQDDESIQNIIDETADERFVMLNTSVAPFDDIRAREALTQATPLENYRQLIGLGISRAANQRFIPESPYYNSDVIQQGDDPDAAVELASAYCADFPENCSDGKINMEYQWSGPSVVQTRIADLLTEGWSSAFNVTFDELPQDEHILQVATGQYNAVTWRQFGKPDPRIDGVWLECRTIGGLSLNWPKFCDPERDALLLEAAASTDQSEREAIYQQVSVQMHDAYTYVFLIHDKWDNAFAENVRGVCDRTSPEGTELRCAIQGRTWHSSVWVAE